MGLKFILGKGHIKKNCSDTRSPVGTIWSRGHVFETPGIGAPYTKSVVSIIRKKGIVGTFDP